jgi:hypothetical protein
MKSSNPTTTTTTINSNSSSHTTPLLTSNSNSNLNYDNDEEKIISPRQPQHQQSNQQQLPSSLFPISILALLTCFTFFLTIILSWINYGISAGTFLPLPTISTTWLYPPFNFISRIVVGMGATSFAILHLTIYYATEDRKGSSGLLFLGLLGTICLALVGAICSSGTSPECLGQPQWHETLAVIFFIVQDFFQIIISYRDGHYTIGTILIMFIGLKYSVYNQQLFTTTPVIDPPGVAEFEWFNVGVIFIFMVYYIMTNCMDYNIGFFTIATRKKSTLTTDDETEEIQWVMSGTLIGGITSTIGLVLILVTYSIATSRGDFPTFPQYTPEVSTLFIFAPGNYLSRFFGVQGGNLLAFFLVIAIRAVISTSPLLPSKIVTIISGNIVIIICAISLAFSLCVNNVESNFYHYLSVGWFFTTWTLLLCFWFSPVDWRSLNFAILSVMTKIRFLLPIDWDDVIFNMLEFSDVFIGLVWIAMFTWFHSDKLQKNGFGIIKKVKQQQ